MDISGEGGSMMQSSCVGKPTNRGGLPAYVAHFCFSGGHYVSFSYYSLKLNANILSQLQNRATKTRWKTRMTWIFGQAIKIADSGKPHAPELLSACVFFPNRILLNLITLFSLPSLIKSGYYMQPSHLHHKPQTSLTSPVEHGKTISGRKSA